MSINDVVEVVSKLLVCFIIMYMFVNIHRKNKIIVNLINYFSLFEANRMIKQDIIDKSNNIHSDLDKFIKEYKQENKTDKKRHYTIKCQWYGKKDTMFHWVISNGNKTAYIKTPRTYWKAKTYIGRINRFLDKKARMISKQEYDNAIIKGNIYKEFIHNEDVASVTLKFLKKEFK